MSRQVTNDSEALQAFADLIDSLPLTETKHIVGTALSLASYYGFRRGQGASTQSAFNFAVMKYAEVLESTMKKIDPSQYRRLEKGEVILPTDDYYDDQKKTWLAPADSVGGLAPDPNYTAHRQFRRKIGDVPGRERSANETAMLAGCCIGLREENAANFLTHEKINWRVRRRDGHVITRRKIDDVPVPNRVNLTISNGIVIRVEMW